MSRIRLVIDRLVLNGVESSAQKPLVDGLRTELSRLLAHRGVRGQLAHSRRALVVRLGQLPLEPGPWGGRRFGASVARKIARGFKG